MTLRAKPHSSRRLHLHHRIGGWHNGNSPALSLKNQGAGMPDGGMFEFIQS